MNVHATSIAWNEQAVLISGPPGSGKSSLALSCIDAGAKLIADDQTILKREGGMLLASCPETIEGCLAIRSVGIFHLASLPHAAVLCEIEIESDRPGWQEIRYDGVSLAKLALPKNYRPTPALLRHLLMSQDGARPEVWLQALEEISMIAPRAEWA